MVLAVTAGNQVLYKVELKKGRGDAKEEIDLFLDEAAKFHEEAEWYLLVD